MGIIKTQFTRCTSRKQLDDLLRYHRYVNLARSYGDLNGKVAQKQESQRIKCKILFNESMKADQALHQQLNESGDDTSNDDT